MRRLCSRYLEQFLKKASERYELAIFTYSIREYADQVIDRIDCYKLIKHRFYREQCDRVKKNEKFGIVKDLSKVGVPLNNIILVDNS